MAREDKAPVPVRNWALMACAYKPPELKVLVIRGTVDDGHTVITNALADKVAPLTYRTEHGSLYRLEGPPEESYAKFCDDAGIALDLADPVKFRAELSEFEWLPDGLRSLPRQEFLDGGDLMSPDDTTTLRNQRRETDWFLREVGRLRGTPVYTVPAAIAALEGLAQSPGGLVQALGPSNEAERHAVDGVVDLVRQILATWAQSNSKEQRDGQAVHALYGLLRKGYVAR